MNNAHALIVKFHHYKFYKILKKSKRKFIKLIRDNNRCIHTHDYHSNCSKLCIFAQIINNKEICKKIEVKINKINQL